jgi:hypothetical protein
MSTELKSEISPERLSLVSFTKYYNAQFESLDMRMTVGYEHLLPGLLATKDSQIPEWEKDILLRIPLELRLELRSLRVRAVAVITSAINNKYLNEQDDEGRTALILAIMAEGRVSLWFIILLLETNININIEDVTGRSAIDYARDAGREDILGLLAGSSGETTRGSTKVFRRKVKPGDVGVDWNGELNQYPLIFSTQSPTGYMGFEFPPDSNSDDDRRGEGIRYSVKRKKRRIKRSRKRRRKRRRKRGTKSRGKRR